MIGRAPDPVRPRAGAWIETPTPRSLISEIPFAPARGRGLKPCIVAAVAADRDVRPRAGAWIETHMVARDGKGFMFAPAGGWIETIDPGYTVQPIMVRPRAGAWIETGSFASNTQGSMFAPARGRGLKLGANELNKMSDEFAPARGRGLKQILALPDAQGFRVRPRAGAWIETET